MYLDASNKKIIIIKFKIRDIGITEKTRFLLFLFSSATSLLMATGKPRLAIAINKVKVGEINIYRPVPSVPRSLAKTIFINILIILVINPPIVKIKTDFINVFFFILDNMF